MHVNRENQNSDFFSFAFNIDLRERKDYFSFTKELYITLHMNVFFPIISIINSFKMKFSLIAIALSLLLNFHSVKSQNETLTNNLINALFQFVEGK